MSLLTDMKNKYSSNGNQKGNGNFTRSITYYNWKSGDNNIRLVGKPIVTRTYYLPKSIYSPIDIFNKDAFDRETNENAIPKVMNCANWDIESEEWKDNGDVLFNLNKIAREMIRVGQEQGVPAESLKEWELIKSRTNPSLQYRWLGFDRDSPYVLETINGRTTIKEPKELAGYKLMTFQKTMFEQLCAAQEAYGDDDIFSEDKGCDLVVKKIDGNKATYTVQLKMNGRQVVETPLTDEERAIEVPNLFEICGKQVPNELVMANLLDKYVDMLNDPTFSDIINGSNKQTKSSSTTSSKASKPTKNVDSAMETEDEDDIPF